MASSAFTYGVLETTQPSISSECVYHWFAEPGPDENSIQLQVLYREFDPSAISKHGPVFQGDDFTIENTIRRYLDAEAQVRIDKLAIQYEQKTKEMFQSLMDRRDERKTDTFVRMFDDPKTTGIGLGLFEDYETTKVTPQLKIDRCVFPAQGDHAEKRIRMIVQLESGEYAPATLCGIGSQPSPWGDMRLLSGGLTVGSPKLFPMLHALLNIMTSSINIAVPLKTFYELGNVTPDLKMDVVPTILNTDVVAGIVASLNRDMKDIRHMGSELVTMFGDKFISLINREIDHRIAGASSFQSIEPLLKLVEYDIDCVSVDVPSDENSNPHHDNQMDVERAHGDSESDIGDPIDPEDTSPGIRRNDPPASKLQRITRMKHHALLTAIRSLTEDPILFVRGPNLSPLQSVEITEDNIINFEKDRSGFRVDLLHGFNTQDLLPLVNVKPYKRGSSANNDEVSFYTFYFDNTNNNLDELGRNKKKLLARIISGINTLYNLLINKKANMVVRLSDWIEATKHTMTPYKQIPSKINVEEDIPIPFSNRTWDQYIKRPSDDRMFRLHLMNPPSETLGIENPVNLMKTEMDFDEVYKPFELDISLGDVDKYVGETLTVCRLALQMILTPVTDASPLKDPITKSIKDGLYKGIDHTKWIDLFIPLVIPPTLLLNSSMEPECSQHTQDNLVYTEKSATSSFPRIFMNKKRQYSVSACSEYLYHHAVLHSSAPFSKDKPSYEDLGKLLATLNPFPLSDKTSQQFCVSVLNELEKAFRTEYENGLELVQSENRMSTIANQPVPPIFIQFSKTIEQNGELHFSSGSETTMVLEAVVLTARLIKVLMQDKERTLIENTRVFEKGSDKHLIDVTQGSIITKRNALQQHPSKLVGFDHVFKTSNTASDCVLDFTQYARWLGLNQKEMYNQAGNVFFTSSLGHIESEKRGVVGQFKWIPLMRLNIADTVSDDPYNPAINVSVFNADDLCYTEPWDLGDNEMYNERQQQVTKSSYIRFFTFNTNVIVLSNELSYETYSDAFIAELYNIMGAEEHHDWNVRIEYGKDVINSGPEFPSRKDKIQSIKYTRNQVVSLPMWFISGDDDDGQSFVGFCVFDEFTATLRRTRLEETISIEVDWNNTSIQKFICLNDTAMIQIGGKEDQIWYGFTKRVIVGFPKMNAHFIIFSAGRPLSYLTKKEKHILEKTASLQIEPEYTGEPFKFEMTTEPCTINKDQIVSVLKKGMQGLHYSNSKALKRTVHAVATGMTRDNVIKLLKKRDPRYPSDNVPWACSKTDKRTKHGNVVLLHILYSDHTATKRSIQPPLADRVIVQVRGPGPDSLTTECVVNGWYYRTDLFLVIETKLLNQMKQVLATNLGSPKNCVCDSVAKIMQCNPSINLYKLLEMKPGAAQQIANVMIQITELDHIGQTTSKGRDKNAILVLQGNISTGISNLLYRV